MHSEMLRREINHTPQMKENIDPMTVLAIVLVLHRY